ncbi:MAG: FHA domain-containing protein [Pyrinomonadaceae bacterium]
MIVLKLTFPTPEGSKEITVDGDRITLGRGSEAELRFADDGLSRLHATIYRDGSRVWVVDENSSNGTFVNGQPAAPSGTPLKHGDRIGVGHRTEIHIWVSEVYSRQVEPATPMAANAAAPPQPVTPGGVSLVPIAMIAVAILMVSLSAVFIGYMAFGGSSQAVAQNTDPYDDLDDEDPEPRPSPGSTTKTNETGVKEEPLKTLPDLPKTGNTPVPSVLKGRKYLDVSENEKRQYLSERAIKIAQLIGNSSSDAIPAEALEKIKSFTDAYAKRLNVKPLGGCRFGDNLQVTYKRASENAPFIVKAFNAKGIDPIIGLYLAMIESEHCVCLQSPTGPLGMFQFTKATGERYGLKTISGASPNNPDERCEPEPSANAAAAYIKSLLGRYGTGAASVPLAIGSYNSGEGGLSSNLVKALESNSGLERDFWTLIANGERLSKQFQAENFKYVPKFFAAAIVGENPQDFGLTLQPLSTYSN